MMNVDQEGNFTFNNSIHSQMKQKNISCYFSSLKRSSSKALQDMKDDTIYTTNKKEKKRNNDYIFANNLSGQTRENVCSNDNNSLKKYFQNTFSKDEALNDLKSGFRKLDIIGSRHNPISKNIEFDYEDNKQPLIGKFFKKIEDIHISPFQINQEILNNNTNNNHQIFSLENIYQENQKDFVQPLTEQFKKQISSGNLFQNNNNPQNSTKVHYSDLKITNWVKFKTCANFNGMNDILFQNIHKYLTFKEMSLSQLVCRTWQGFYRYTISDYQYYSIFDSSKFTKREFTEVLKKGRHLKHIQKINEIIKRDFGGEKHPENLYNKVFLSMNCSNMEDILFYNGTLLDSFRIKPKQMGFNNFVSNESICMICYSSKFTLKELLLRNCFKLSNKLSSGLKNCQFLEKLELSHNSNIDDELILLISQNCKQLKVLNLSNCVKLTEKSLMNIGSGLINLEGLDLSENINIKGEFLIYLKVCTKINTLLLSGIKLIDNDLKILDYLHLIKTLVISNAQTLTDNSIQQIKQNCKIIQNLKIDKNPNFTESPIFELVKELTSLKILITDTHIISPRLKSILTRRN
jgi:hypothetical protein